MIPLQVTLEGFLSYKEKQVINFDGSSLWVLWGPNGVGKSAVFDAITFALFNTHRANRGTRGTPKDLINHHADKLIVTFDFIADGVIYRIKRIHPRRGRSTREAFIVNSADTGNLDDAPTKRLDDTDNEDGFNRWIKQVIGMDYAAFTSSCLLLQGKSEQLLGADPKSRYTILAELIDLSRYQKLCEAAERRRGDYKARVETLEQQLRSPAVHAISDEEMDKARKLLEDAELAWQNAQDDVELFSKYLEQALHWEAEIVELQEKSTKLQNALRLLERKAEIIRGYTELQELQNVLPTLDQIVKGRISLVNLKGYLDKLQCQRSHLEENISIAKNKRDVEEQEVLDLEQAVARMQGESTGYLIRLSKLSPMVSKLEQVELLQTESAAIEEQLAKLPPDIVQQLAQAEQLLNTLEEKEHTLRWLKMFARERNNVAAALEREQAANARVTTLREQYRELVDSRTVLQTAYIEAQEVERSLYGEKQSSYARLQDAQKRLRGFESVATKLVCDLCGQEITGEHALQEKARLQQQLEECKCYFWKIEQKYQNALREKNTKEQEAASLDAQIEEVKNSGRQAKQEKETVYEKVGEHTTRLCEAFDAMGETFQRCIIEAIPEDTSVWLATVYPTQSDMNTIEQEVRSKKAHTQTVTQLRGVHNTWQGLCQQKSVFDRQIVEQLQSLDIDTARNARAEKNVIAQKQETLAVDIEKKRQALERARKTAQETGNSCKELDAKLQKCLSNIQAETGRYQESERRQHMQEESLPEQWRSSVDTLDEAGLIALEQRRINLSSYHSLNEQLIEARQCVSLYRQDIKVLDARIATYPPEAKRPANVVEEELLNRKNIHTQAGGERDELRESLTSLERQRQRRQELEQQKLEAEKLHHLYSTLAKYLGRSGLQLFLLGRAEHAIVDFANQTLSGLSHGRMRLELRHESDLQAQAEKALDLVVYDRATGEHAVPIALVSGSQQFRIAVSLALGIGRYMSREARNTESVIIDEGFGSLDKVGCDDMIQELSTLGQQLSRIILVSHQEEFASAFPNRYRFKLVDGSSSVTLMEEE